MSEEKKGKKRVYRRATKRVLVKAIENIMLNEFEFLRRDFVRVMLREELGKMGYRER